MSHSPLPCRPPARRSLAALLALSLAAACPAGARAAAEAPALTGQAVNDATYGKTVETASGDKDGIPTAILEGMSTALPIVATDAGSIPEILTDGAHGFLVKQRDPQALAKAIQQLAAQPMLARDLGRAARIRFEEEGVNLFAEGIRS